MQFQNTDVNAPILNDHISSQGNDNITNSNVGNNNVIVNNGSTVPGLLSLTKLARPLTAS